jgi:hypothetical protein
MFFPPLSLPRLLPELTEYMGKMAGVFYLSFCTFIWPLCCLFFVDIRILIAPFVSSNSFNAKQKFIFYLCFCLFVLFVFVPCLAFLDDPFLTAPSHYLTFSNYFNKVNPL